MPQSKVADMETESIVENKCLESIIKRPTFLMGHKLFMFIW